MSEFEFPIATGIELEVRQMMRAVMRSIPLETFELSEEFFPAHLPVALIDAVFGFRLRNDQAPTVVAERYCRHFGIARTRTDRWDLPLVAEQESVDKFIGHYDELGINGMARKVFRTRSHFPGTNVRRAEYVLRLAQELRRVGVDYLQHMWASDPQEIDVAVRTLRGVDEHIVRMLCTYTGTDEFVWSDVRVREFVASAIDRKTITSAGATQLVRRTAHELIVSPRFLGYQIWKCCAVEGSWFRFRSEDTDSIPSSSAFPALGDHV